MGGSPSISNGFGRSGRLAGVVVSGVPGAEQARRAAEHPPFLYCLRRRRARNGTNAQKWTGNGLELVNVGSNRCLDATGNSSADGNRLQIWDCANTTNQRWNLPR